MRWITTTLPLSFGSEDDGEEFDIRFAGIYSPGYRGRREDGVQLEPDEPASFEVYSVQVHVGGPSGDGWVSFPQVLLTDRMEEQLARIGIAEELGRIERAIRSKE